jgi:hypothetical protein
MFIKIIITTNTFFYSECITSIYGNGSSLLYCEYINSQYCFNFEKATEWNAYFKINENLWITFQLPMSDFHLNDVYLFLDFRDKHSYNNLSNFFKKFKPNEYKY